MSIDLLVPDLGNFSDVEVVDVLVKPGDVVEVDTPLVTLETDKAALDVPATGAGKISGSSAPELLPVCHAANASATQLICTSR